MVLQRWVPDRTPTWTDVLVACLVLVWIPVNLASLETIYWGRMAIGFVVGVISLGPVAASPIGRRIGTWFREIGATGRAIAIVLFAVAVLITGQRVDVPSEHVTSAVGGFMLALLGFTFAHVALADEISGWKAH